jgi:hypothetical protein
VPWTGELVQRSHQAGNEPGAVGISGSWEHRRGYGRREALELTVVLETGLVEPGEVQAQVQGQARATGWHSQWGKRRVPFSVHWLLRVSIQPQIAGASLYKERGWSRSLLVLLQDSVWPAGILGGNLLTLAIFFILFFLIVCVCVCVRARARARACAQMHTHLPQDTCRGQRISLWSGFSPSTFTQVLGIKPRRPGLHSKCLYPQSHLTSSTVFLDKEPSLFLDCICYCDLSFVIALHKEDTHTHTHTHIHTHLKGNERVYSGVRIEWSWPGNMHLGYPQMIMLWSLYRYRAKGSHKSRHFSNTSLGELAGGEISVICRRSCLMMLLALDGWLLMAYYGNIPQKVSHDTHKVRHSWAINNSPRSFASGPATFLLPTISTFSSAAQPCRLLNTGVAFSENFPSLWQNLQSHKSITPGHLGLVWKTAYWISH